MRRAIFGTTMILVLILSSGCQSFVKDKTKEYAAAALEGARTWWETGGKEDTITLAKGAAADVLTRALDKMDAAFEEKYGNPPSFYENSDGSTDWSGLAQGGAGMIAAYLALHNGRKGVGWLAGKRTEGIVTKVAAKVTAPPPGAV